MSSHPLRGKTALVTGATRGIGRGIAIALGQAGMRVYFTGRTERGPLSLEATSREIRRMGGEAVSVKLDHENDSEVRNLFDKIEQDSGTLDVLVNNAYKGVATLIEGTGKKFWEMGGDDGSPGSHWDIINGIGLRGHYICAVYATRLMRKNGTKGVIVNVSSFGGLGTLFDVAYGVGKCALDRMGMDMKQDLEGTGIRCVTIWPGFVRTEKIQESKETAESSSIAWNSESPLYVGRAVVHLLSHEREVYRANGKIVISAELGKRYGLIDEDGKEKLSFRGTRFLILLALPFLVNWRFRWLIPDFLIPWWLVKLVFHPSPRFR